MKRDLEKMLTLYELMSQTLFRCFDLGDLVIKISDNDSNAPSILQEDSYYPFGLKLPGMSFVDGTENKYTYNGKELVNDLDLNWYHYGARYYDPTLGRWHSIDSADEFYSPYVYCANNPVMLVDPDGCETTNPTDDLDNFKKIQFSLIMNTKPVPQLEQGTSGPELCQQIGPVINPRTKEINNRILSAVDGNLQPIIVDSAKEMGYNNVALYGDLFFTLLDYNGKSPQESAEKLTQSIAYSIGKGSLDLSRRCNLNARAAIVVGVSAAGAAGYGGKLLYTACFDRPKYEAWKKYQWNSMKK